MTVRKRIRMIDVAAAAGVSQAAVSMALRDDPQISAAQKQRIRKICRRLNYVAPVSPRTVTPPLRRRMNPLDRIGAVFVGCGVTNPMLVPLADACAHAGIRLEIMATSSSWEAGETQARVTRLGRATDGLVLTDLVDRPLLTALARADVPHVVLGHVMAHPDATSADGLVCAVTPDEIAMGREAVGYLARRDHRRIGFVSGELLPGFYYARWFDGFRLGCLDAGQAPGPACLTGPQLTDETQGARLETLLQRRDAPTGFVCTNAVFAWRLVNAAARVKFHLPREAVVIGDVQEQITLYSYEKFPALVVDGRRMVALALRLLERQRAGERDCFGEWVVSHRRQNLSDR